MAYEEILDRFKAQLRIMGLKVTRERVIILEEVMKRKDHFDDLLKCIQRYEANP